MPVHSAIASQELAARIACQLGRAMTFDLAVNDDVAVTVHLTDVGDVLVTTFPAYHAPRLVGRPWAVRVARMLGVGAVAERVQ